MAACHVGMSMPHCQVAQRTARGMKAMRQQVLHRLASRQRLQRARGHGGHLHPPLWVERLHTAACWSVCSSVTRNVSCNTMLIRKRTETVSQSTFRIFQTQHSA